MLAQRSAAWPRWPRAVRARAVAWSTTLTHAWMKLASKYEAAERWGRGDGQDRSGSDCVSTYCGASASRIGWAGRPLSRSWRSAGVTPAASGRRRMHLASACLPPAPCHVPRAPAPVMTHVCNDARQRACGPNNAPGTTPAYLNTLTASSGSPTCPGSTSLWRTLRWSASRVSCMRLRTWGAPGGAGAEKRRGSSRRAAGAAPETSWLLALRCCGNCRAFFHVVCLSVPRASTHTGCAGYTPRGVQ